MFDPSALKEDCVLLVKFVSDAMWAWCQRLGFDGHLFVIHDGGGVTGYLLQFDHPTSKTRAERAFPSYALRKCSLYHEEALFLLGNFPQA